MKCTDCGIEIETGFFDEGLTLCDSCASRITEEDENFFKCAKCGAWLHIDDSIDGDGVTCDGCGAWTPLPIKF